MRWMKHEAWIDVLELALVAALGVALAHVTWLALTPRTAGTPSALGESAFPQSATLAARQVFGAPSGASTAKPGVTATGLVLLGVFSSPKPGAGRAILRVQGSRAAVIAAGEQIADGVELREVHADHVIVLRQGTPERIELERSGSRASAPPPALPASAGR